MDTTQTGSFTVVLDPAYIKIALTVVAVLNDHVAATAPNNKLLTVSFEVVEKFLEAVSASLPREDSDRHHAQRLPN